MESTIGQRFREGRKKIRLTQGEVAEELIKEGYITEEITQSSISQFEKAESTLPLYLIKYAYERFNVNLNWLMIGVGEKFRDTDPLYKENQELKKEVKTMTEKFEEKIIEIHELKNRLKELQSKP